MIGRLLHIVSILFLAICGGTLLTWYSLPRGDGFDTITIGQWIAYPTYGTPDANPYAKARLSRDGAVAIGSAERLSFYADVDADGAPLTGSCDYVLQGTPPPARFWTLYPVSTNRQALPETGTALPTSLYSGNTVYEPDGRFIIHISAMARPDNWLAVPRDTRYALTLALYDSPIASNKGLIETQLPELRRVNCRG